jgi:hypothetical protein
MLPQTENLLMLLLLLLLLVPMQLAHAAQRPPAPLQTLLMMLVARVA